VEIACAQRMNVARHFFLTCGPMGAEGRQHKTNVFSILVVYNTVFIKVKKNNNNILSY